MCQSPEKRTGTEEVAVTRFEGEKIWTLKSGFPDKLIKVSEDCSGYLEAVYVDKLNKPT